MRAPPRKSSGFTLIELMVTVVIGAILASIAVPMYTAQMRQSRRTEARTALLDMASREERYSSTNSAYSSAPANLGYSGAFPVVVGSGYYQISACVNTAITSCPGADAGTGATFLLTATPVATSPQSKDTACGSFTLDSTGVQNVTGPSGATTCWNN